jgi:hypothetical protein
VVSACRRVPSRYGTRTSGSSARKSVVLRVTRRAPTASRGRDDGVGQFEPVVAPKGHRASGDLPVEVDDGGGGEKGARRRLALRRRADPAPRPR